jgi:plasmid maintenance system antidote protein VapI/Zn-dependent peptidase ImmA (M78 family)
MPSTEAFCPDWASAPGDTIADILRERSVSIGEFARRIGRTKEEAVDLLRGRSAITIGLARQLERVLGGSVEFWMARDFQYRQQTASPGEATNAWVRELPLPDMVKFGWLRPVPTRSEELAACLGFFDVPNVAVWHRVYARLEQKFLFRASPSFKSRALAVAAWLRQGEIEAEKITCAPWNRKGFEGSLPLIRSLTREKDPKRFVARLRQLCAESGVAVAIVRSPSGCHASGATRFVAKDKALLLLSFRHLTDDQFWFSFFHEAGHLLVHDHQELFIEGIEAPESAAETEANEFAFRILIPGEYQPELLRLRRSTFEVARFARRVGVSPGIVVGQLQHWGRIRPNHFNGLKRRYKWD